MIPIKMWNDGNELNKPENSSLFNKNAVFSKKTNSLHNEYGFKIISEYNLSSGFTLEPIGFIPIISNKLIVLSVVLDNTDFESEIGIIENDIYRPILRDNLSINTSFKFNTQNLIQGTFKVGINGDIIIYWVDGSNSDKWLNVTNPQVSRDSLLRIGVAGEIQQMIGYKINSNINIDLISVETGGSLETGVYYIVPVYVSNNNETFSLSVSNPISISAFNGWGAVAGTVSNKSIQLQIPAANLDNSFESVRIYVISKINQTLKGYNYGTFSNTGNDINISVSNLTNSVIISPDSILINNSSYKSALTITSLDDVLYKGYLRSFNEINLQSYINNISVQWVSKPLNVTNGLSGGYKDAVNSFYNKSFMWDEVYGLALSLIIEEDNIKYETRAYHIPGRTSKSITLGTWTGDETDDIDTISDTNYYNTGAITDTTPGGQITNVNSEAKVYQGFDTADDSGVTNNMGYWENRNEQYPDNENWDIKDESGVVIGTIRGDNVRHHKFPDPFEHDIQMHENSSGGAYGEVNILGVKLHNIVIPNELSDKIVGYKLHYVKRDINNRTILGQSILLPSHAFHDAGVGTGTEAIVFNSFGCGNMQDLYKETSQYDEGYFSMGLTNLLYDIPSDNINNIYNTGINYPYAGAISNPNYEYCNHLKNPFSLTSGYGLIRPFDLMSQNVSVNSASYIKNLFRIKSRYILSYEAGNSSVTSSPENFSYGFTFIPDISFYGIDRTSYVNNGLGNLIRKIDVKDYIQINQTAQGLGFSGAINTTNFTLGILVQFYNKLYSYVSPASRNGNTQGQDLFIANLQDPGFISVIYQNGYASPYLSNICAYKEDLFVGFENQILAYTGFSYKLAKISGNITNGNNTITNVSSTDKLTLGMQVFGTGIPSNTTITLIAGTTVTLSNNATTTTTAYFTCVEQEDIYGGDTYTGWYGEKTVCDISAYSQNAGLDRTAADLRGLHYYICQSTSNTELRHSGPNNNETFFPFTTAYNVLGQSPDTNNYYGYNIDYSSINDIKQPIINSFQVNTYEELFTNRVIRSAKNNPELDSDNYLIYEAGNSIDIGMELGKLENLDNFVNRLIIQLENGILYSVGREELEVGNVQAYIGSGDIFLAKPKSIVSGQYGGTIGRFNTTVTPYGLIYADPNLGNVYSFTGEELHEISKEGFERFFKENLPFKLPKQLNYINYQLAPNWSNVTAYTKFGVVKYNGELWEALDSNTNQTPVEGQYWTKKSLPEYNIRSTVYNQGLGIIGGYDPFFLRYILRKKDYSYNELASTYQGLFGTNSVGNYTHDLTIITYNNTIGIFWDSFIEPAPSNAIQIGATQFYYIPIDFDNLPLNLEGSFTSLSFTISYYPEVKGWVSWHDYEPKLFATQEQQLYSSNSNIYKHNVLESPFFYNTDLISFETEPLFSVKEKSRLSSVQTKIDYKEYLQVLEGILEDKIIPIYNKTFDSYFVYDSYQISKESTNLIPLSNTRNAEGIWNFNDFRDYTAFENTALLTYNNVWDYDLNTININNNKHWSKLKKFMDYWYATRLKKQFNVFSDVATATLLSVSGQIGTINIISLPFKYVYKMNNSYFYVKSVNSSSNTSTIVFLNSPPALASYNISVFIPSTIALLETTPTIFKNYR